MKFKSKFQAVMWIAALMSLACAVAFHMLSAPNGKDVFSTLRTTALTCLYHFAVRLAIGGLLAPELRLRRIDGFWFRPHRWEAGLYRLLGVQRWKRKVPTYDPSEFDVYRLGAEAVLRASCRAELVHEFNALASFAPLLAARYVGALPVFLITSIAAACFDLVFVIVLRSNRPRLMRMVRKWEKRLRDAGMNAEEDPLR